MPNRNSPIYRGLDHICRILTLLAILMLALMTVLVVGQVILRNLFDLGLPWADELARISNIALVFFVVCYGISQYSQWLERQLATDHR